MIAFTGIQPTSSPHIGNYFAVMKQMIDMQNENKYNIRCFIANYHALTSLQNREVLEENTINLCLDYLAIGLDPEKTLLWKQSDTPEVTELAWIFNTIVSMPFLMMAHGFKDAEARNKEINVGKFDYPILMAADILIHDADIIPVGKDQIQHVEMAREIAGKFNRIYGDEAFQKIPKEFIKEEVKTVPGIDGQKMSKSYNNHIPLFSTDDELKKLVMSIVTNSSGERPENVYQMHKLFKDDIYLEKLYMENAGKYKILKEALLEDIISFVKPLRLQREKYNKNDVIELLNKNGKIAREITSKKMNDIRKIVGL